jgi:GWxTD domain-containing protein
MRSAPAILAAGVIAAALGVLPARAAHALAGADERRAGARAAPRSADYDAPTERWREGPVRYLLTGEEDEAYRLLSTEADRAAFIQKFWASRDPVASTPDNEYRTRFYERVAGANGLFTDSPKPGWKTDRGKIFILLGPPDDLEQEQTRDDFAPNVVVWTYRNPPGGEHMNALPVVRFIRDSAGEYRLSNTVFLPGFETSSGITYQIQAMQMKALPQQKRVLDTIVGGRARLDPGPFRTHGDFFRAVDGNTLTVLTLGVNTDLLAGRPAGSAPAAAAGHDAGGIAGAAPESKVDTRFEAVARLVGVSPEQPTYDFAGPNGLRGGVSGPLLDSSGFLMFQGALPVRPGTYTAYYGVVDPHDGQVYSYRESVVIPDLRAGQFRLSRITLAGLLERVEGGRNAYTTPFVLGDLRVLPRADDLFRNGEEFAFYYQIYGPTTDPIDGRPDLDVEYQFFVAERDGAGGLKFVTLGKPIRLTRQRSQVQGYTLPLRDWPPGTYRLRVQVKDNLNEERSTEEVSFRIL